MDMKLLHYSVSNYIIGGFFLKSVYLMIDEYVFETFPTTYQNLHITSDSFFESRYTLSDRKIPVNQYDIT